MSPDNRTSNPLLTALKRLVNEARGCSAGASRDFHRETLESVLRIATTAIRGYEQRSDEPSEAERTACRCPTDWCRLEQDNGAEYCPELRPNEFCGQGADNEPAVTHWTCPKCKASDNREDYHRISCPHCAALRPAVPPSDVQRDAARYRYITGMTGSKVRIYRDDCVQVEYMAEHLSGGIDWLIENCPHTAVTKSDLHYDTAANKARHVLEPATWMPPCPICHSHKCRKTAEECDRARLGSADDPMTQLDDELRGSDETSEVQK